jgi:hypothetical protein
VFSGFTTKARIILLLAIKNLPHNGCSDHQIDQNHTTQLPS